MENFPQSFEPVGSDSILEQFIQLKKNLKDILSSNEYLKTIEQNLTEEQKAQVRENIGAGSATINVIDNLVSTSIVDPLSANQGRVLNEKITNDIESLRRATTTIFSQLQNQIDDNIEDISELFQQSARALKTPLTSPFETEIVGVDTSNSQVGLTIGTGLKLENGTLKAGQNYSTSEQFTGNYWTNGKPIYRKCTTVTIPSTLNKWNYIWTISSEIVILLKVDVNLYHSNYEQYPNKLEVYSNGKEMFEQHTSDYFNGKKLYIIVEYIYE